MRYTYEFKKKAVELYRQGKWIDAPNDIINLKNFHDMIVRWHHLEESNTSDCLKHYGTNKKWSPEEKYELVARVIAGDTITSVAYTVGINSGLLAQWIRKYKIWGYNGLVGRRKGRKPKESAMKKMNINIIWAPSLQRRIGIHDIKCFFELYSIFKKYTDYLRNG